MWLTAVFYALIPGKKGKRKPLGSSSPGCHRGAKKESPMVQAHFSICLSCTSAHFPLATPSLSSRSQGGERLSPVAGVEDNKYFSPAVFNQYLLEQD